jgi:hypothetical protein
MSRYELFVRSRLAGMMGVTLAAAGVLARCALEGRTDLYILIGLLALLIISLLTMLVLARARKGLNPSLFNMADDGEEPEESGSDSLREDMERAIAQGASPETRNELGWTFLHEACVAGDEEAAAYLLDQGASLEARDSLGFTPLHTACRLVNEDMVRFLVSHGAPLEARDTIGWTPLHIAIGMGAKGIVEFLLISGADPAAEAYGDGTALEIAECQGKRAIADLLRSYLKRN